MILEIDTREDNGGVNHVYIKLTDTKIIETREIVLNQLQVDIDQNGNVAGVCIIGPFKNSDLKIRR